MSNRTTNTLGSTLKDFREKKGLTLTEAAAHLKIDFSMLARIEKSQRSVNDALFKKFAKLFGIDENELRALDLADKIHKKIWNNKYADKALKIVSKRISKSRENA